MINRSFIICLLICKISTSLLGQGNIKIYQLGDTLSETTTDIALDGDGNVFVAGNITSQLSIGSNYLSYTGGYVTKYDSIGQNHWIIRAGDYGTSFPYSDSYASPEIATDNFGNIYICGFFRDTSYVGDSMIVDTIHLQSTFLAKIDPYGIPLWVKNLTYNVRIRDIEVDIQGNILLTGDFGGSLILDGDTLTNSGGERILIIKLDNVGNLKWMKKAGGFSSYLETGRDIDTDLNGNVYISGMLRSINPMFDSIVLPIQSTFYKGYIAKYDSTGNINYAKLCGYECFAVGCDSSGNGYAGGYLYGATEFDTLMIGGPGGASFFVAKFNNSGVVDYVKMPYSNSGSILRGMDVDLNGNCFVAGNATDTLRIAGLTDSLEIINSTCSQQGFFVKLDDLGNPVYGNSFRGCGPLGLIYDIKYNNCLLAFSGSITTSVQPLYYNNDSLFGYGAVDGIAIVEDVCNLNLGYNVLFNNTSLNVFPNPIVTNVTFRIENINILEINLLNNCGNSVFSKKVNSREDTIDMSEYPNGLFFYNVIDSENHVHVGKLIKLE